MIFSMKLGYESGGTTKSRATAILVLGSPKNRSFYASPQPSPPGEGVSGRIFRTALLSLGILFLLGSCKKIQEDKILSGTWEVVKVELDHGDYNVMETFLRNYKSNHACCKYIVDFRDDNTCSGTYYRDDSLIYTVEGEWELKEFNLVYVNLDQYVYADLDVNRHSKTYYTLATDSNTVKALNDVLPTTLEIKRLN